MGNGTHLMRCRIRATGSVIRHVVASVFLFLRCSRNNKPHARDRSSDVDYACVNACYFFLKDQCVLVLLSRAFIIPIELKVTRLSYVLSCVQIKSA